MYFNWVIPSPVRTQRYAETWSDIESQLTGCGPEPARASTRAPVGVIIALLQTPKAGGGTERRRPGEWGKIGLIHFAYQKMYTLKKKKFHVLSVNVQ